MSQYMLVADTHLGHKSTIESFDLTLRLFREICDTAKERGIQNFIHLGDFFHGKTISFKMLEYVNKIRDLLESSFSYSYIIVGNHDIYFKNKIVPNGLSIFDPSPSISVIEEPKKINDKITLFPWITTENIGQIKEVDTKYLLGHFPINGIPMNRHGFTNENLPLNITDLKQFNVISGHFHQPSDWYLGSPQHFDFNDTGERGFYIFDDEEETLEFIPFIAPKFVILNPNEEYSKEDIQGNHVRIDFHERWGDTEIEKKIKEIEGSGALSVKTRYFFTAEMEVEGKEEEVTGNKEIIDTYLDNIEYPKGIKEKTLKSIMNGLYNECMEE